MEVANYIIETNATVRQAAKQFGISKSTVHMVVTIWNGFGGWWSNQIIREKKAVMDHGGWSVAAFYF